MLNALHQIIKKRQTAVVLVAILVAAFFVRFYDYDDWLYFKMDQSRDAQLVSHAIKDGPAMLPLLGPRAGATDVDNGFLRLGPAFYYFQYISGAIFNSTEPQIFAYPDLFFSILAIALLYFFSKIYFSKNISLLIAAMYAFSFIVIQYSRFAWNPNSLQFFTLLTFFGLLKFLNAEKMKTKIGWLSIWALALAIGSQLHFFGFFVLSGVSGLLILLRSRFWKTDELKKYFQVDFLKKMAVYVLTFAFIFAFIYTPVIISDVMNKGENSKNFVQALSSKPSGKPLADKIEKNITENIKYYCLITTSFCGEGKVGDHPVPAAATILLVLAGMFLAIRAIRKEPMGARKDFLTLLFIWIGVFFILTTPVSFDLRPRFFILVFAVPFILAGFLFEFIREKWPAKSAYLIAPVAVLILGSNVFGTWAWFQEQKKSQLGSSNIDRTLILKAKDGVTLKQLQGAADFMRKRIAAGNTIYFYVKPEHVQPIKYLLQQKADPPLKYATLNLNLNADPNAQYFAIIPTHADPEETMRNKYANPIEILASEKLGQISVYEISFLERKISKDFRINKKTKKTDRVFWKDAFGLKGAIIEDVDMDE